MRLLQSHLSLRRWCAASVDGSAEWCITCPLITLAWISLRRSWSSSSSNVFYMWWHKSGTGAKAFFQKIDLLPTRRSSSVRSRTTVTHLSSRCSHFSLAPVDEYTPKQEAAGVQRANLSVVDFPEPSDLYISLSQRHIHSNLARTAPKSSSVKRKKKKKISPSFR